VRVMASADRPDNVSDPAPSAELSVQMQRLFRAIDDVLVANHTLLHSLAEDHLAFTASLAEGVKRYGEGPLFALWQQCRAVDALRLAWTGQRTARDAA
jgi:hypothetical protein